VCVWCGEWFTLGTDHGSSLTRATESGDGVDDDAENESGSCRRQSMCMCMTMLIYSDEMMVFVFSLVRS
jgi:hypothetical protein